MMARGGERTPTIAYSLRKYRAGAAASARQVPTKPSAKHLQDHGVINPPLMPGGHRAAEHQHSGSERHERDEPQRGSYGPDHPRHRGKRLPHRDRRDIRKTFGDL